MLMLANNVRIFIGVSAVDMRKQFNGLHAVVSEELKEDIFGGALFVFSNKERNRVKILYWDGSGLWVFAKRLERGRLSWPKALSGASGKKLIIEPVALEMLLSGIDLKDGCKKSWYER